MHQGTGHPMLAFFERRVVVPLQPARSERSARRLSCRVAPTVLFTAAHPPNGNLTGGLLSVASLSTPALAPLGWPSRPDGHAGPADVVEFQAHEGRHGGCATLSSPWW